jgi:hypothetical protein
MLFILHYETFEPEVSLNNDKHVSFTRKPHWVSIGGQHLLIMFVGQIAVYSVGHNFTLWKKPEPSVLKQVDNERTMDFKLFTVSN